jgi:hypothetical protein
MSTFTTGGRLPGIARTDGTTAWRPQYTRDALLLAVLHGAGCEACARYRQALAAAEPDFHSWGGRLLVAVAGETEGGGEAGVAAPEGFGEAPGIIVADRFGQIYHAEQGGRAHTLSEPRELEAWLRFIGTQCPE